MKERLPLAAFVAFGIYVCVGIYLLVFRHVCYWCVNSTPAYLIIMGTCISLLKGNKSYHWGVWGLGMIALMISFGYQDLSGIRYVNLGSSYIVQPHPGDSADYMEYETARYTYKGMSNVVFSRVSRTREQHGYGVAVWKNGERFEGIWEHGCVHKGIYTWPNGTRFEGTWKKKSATANYMEDGIEYRKDGRIFRIEQGVSFLVSGSDSVNDKDPADSGGNANASDTERLKQNTTPNAISYDADNVRRKKLEEKLDAQFRKEEDMAQE